MLSKDIREYFEKLRRGTKEGLGCPGDEIQKKPDGLC